jgi:hypothetical protein
MTTIKLAACFVPLAVFAISCAKKVTSPAPSAAIAPQSSLVDGRPVIVRLISRDEVLTISKGPAGTLYSVEDAKGRMLISAITREELRTRHPYFSAQLDSAIATSDVRNLPDRPMPAQMIAPMPTISADGPLMLRRD